MYFSWTTQHQEERERRQWTQQKRKSFCFFAKFHHRKKERKRLRFFFSSTTTATTTKYKQQTQQSELNWISSIRERYWVTMEIELESRVKALPYKVKATSRESPSQKAGHVLDSDLRTHWSTATNTKEWILLELDVPFSLSFIHSHTLRMCKSILLFFAGTLFIIAYSDLQQVCTRMGNCCWLALQG